MALPALALPIALGAFKGLEMGMASGQNQKNLKYQESVNQQNTLNSLWLYQRQRKDALNDWKRETDYNSPSAQMQRLRDAGLNPNLVYGSGSATTTSPDISKSTASAPRLESPHSDYVPDLTGTLSTYLDASVKNIQSDNLSKQGALIEAQTANTDMDTANKGIEGARSKYSLALAQEMKDSIILEQKNRAEKIGTEIENIKVQQEFSKLRIDQKDVELAIRKNELQLKKAKTAAEISKVNEDILRSIVYRQTNPIIQEKLLWEIQNLKQMDKLKDLEQKAKDAGFNPGQPEFYQKIINLLNPLSALK